MLNSLKIIHIQGSSENHYISDSSAFEIKTCQRTIIIQTIPFLYRSEASEYFEGKEAYQFLLETICGLKSKLLGESEIVAQFKEAFQSYLSKETRSTIVLKVLEKLFKDAKEIRRNYLLKIGQQSYAGITRKIIQVNSISNNILILGSGQLATDMIKQLDKKFNIYISARNSDKIDSILDTFNTSSIEVVPWGDRDLYKPFTTIINTIGADCVLFNHDFFSCRNKKNSLFIDLASPSVIQTSLTKAEGVFRLTDIFSQGKNLTKEKNSRIERAKSAIGNIVDKRVLSLGHNYPFSWEELQFS